MAVERFSVVGIDHHRSPIELRERMAVASPDLVPMTADLCEVPGVEGAVVVSTCNRCEFYLVGAIDHDRLCARLAERQGVAVPELQEHAYRLVGHEAVTHLLRVAASLESMVVGEYQILHQVRHAYEQSRAHRHTGPVLDHVFQRALAAGKEVRNATAIGRHKLSMAAIAVDLAEHIHGRLGRCALLVVGAGEMAELAVRHFIDRGVRRITVINRNRERALQLGGEHANRAEIAVRSWPDLTANLATHDVILTSTAATQPILTAEMVRHALGKRRHRLMLIDLAVPRDVDPAVSELDDAFVYNVDHLEQVAHSHQRLRDDEVEEAVRLIETRAAETVRDADPDRNELRAQVAAWFDEVVTEEARRLANKLGLGEDEAREAKHALTRTAGKLQHRLHRFLGTHGDDQEALRLVRELLEL